MTIEQDLNTMNTSPYWEGYIVDLNPCGVNQLLQLTSCSDSDVGFGVFGTFIPFPIKGTGYECTAGQSPQPTIQISNITKIIQPYVQQYNDMVGAKITRVRTLSKYLDTGATPDDEQHMPLDVYYIEEKIRHNKSILEFKLTNVLDLPFVKLPRAQVLKDDTGSSNNLYAPGLSSARFR